MSRYLVRVDEHRYYEVEIETDHGPEAAKDIATESVKNRANSRFHFDLVFAEVVATDAVDLSTDLVW